MADTTLRDGEQSPGASLDSASKLRIAHALADAGLDIIDAGFPACSPGEEEAVRQIATEVRQPTITCLSRVKKGDIDASHRALKPAKQSGITLFLGTSPWHRRRVDKDEKGILQMIDEGVKYAAGMFMNVCFAPEDATRTEPEFLWEVLSTAIGAGASALGLADTLGVLFPHEVEDFVGGIKEHVSGVEKVLLAAHFHNDLGLATINTLEAIRAGVKIVQCTVNGLGERAGNTPLEEVVVALHECPERYPVKHNVKMKSLTPLSRLVQELTGIPVGASKPIVGPNVFATEAGIHQDGILKDPETYCPMMPEDVGAEGGIRLVLGKHSGRNAVKHALQRLDIQISDEQFTDLFTAFKTLAETVKEVTDDQLREIAGRFV